MINKKQKQNGHVPLLIPFSSHCYKRKKKPIPGFPIHSFLSHIKVFFVSCEQYNFLIACSTSPLLFHIYTTIPFPSDKHCKNIICVPSTVVFSDLLLLLLSSYRFQLINTSKNKSHWLSIVTILLFSYPEFILFSIDKY